MSNVVISTFQRGGSSLVMQMLHAAGEYCAAPWPAFEDDRALIHQETGNCADWIASEAGMVKLLEPQRFTSSRKIAPRGVWLDRDPLQRAKSMVKFASYLGMPVSADRNTLRRIAKSYRDERPDALAALRRLCETVFIVEFENLIESPQDTADDLATFLNLPAERAAIMAAVVRKRAARCFDGMLEAQLLQEGAPT